MDELIIHPHAYKHGLMEEDILTAWGDALYSKPRGWGMNGFELVVIGFDAKGRLLELVGAYATDQSVLIYHAMTPPTKKTLRELGIYVRPGKRTG